ncbi:MoxR family ATPase [Nonomuraea angiospora]|uniref:AAA family ATPase n=1 Tax=Nonomuraea angiospora TaxID=46172 RepID=UPI00341AA3CD
MTTIPPAPAAPDPRDGAVYVTHPELDLAVDVALATGRPLLLRGKPGSGKSSLAPYVARARGWRYYEHVVTSRTRTTDLLWSFDAVRRLADAQVLGRGARLDDHRYVVPGALWWAFAPSSAARPNTSASDPLEHLNRTRSHNHAVVLIDEIDKADPDVPNGLLVPLGSSEFTVAETGTLVRKENPGGSHLIVLTTNEERELPRAFLRRCVIATLPDPTRERLIQIAHAHFPPPVVDLLAGRLADELLKLRGQTSGTHVPSTAEYLDALRACVALGISPGNDRRWDLIRDLTLVKPRRPEDGDDEW